MRGISVGIAIVGAAFSIPTPAQGISGDPAKIVDDIVACRAITDSAARLACFDRTAAAVADAREKKQIVVLDREGVKKAKRSVFGFSLPNIKLFGGGDDEPEVKEITEKVTSVQNAGNGRLTIRLADGTIWQTTETQLSFSAKPGDTIRVEAGILGSYKAAVGRGRAIKVKRIQ